MTHTLDPEAWAPIRDAHLQCFSTTPPHSHPPKPNTRKDPEPSHGTPREALDQGSTDSTGMRHFLQSTKPLGIILPAWPLIHLPGPHLPSQSHPQRPASSWPGHRAGQASHLFASRLTPRLSQHLVTLCTVGIGHNPFQSTLISQY